MLTLTLFTDTVYPCLFFWYVKFGKICNIFNLSFFQFKGFLQKMIQDMDSVYSIICDLP